MNTAAATKEGVAAYKAGKGIAPALNNKFIADACESKTALAALLEAYIHGWTIANLANDAVDPTMPSVIELARIEAA